MSCVGRKAEPNEVARIQTPVNSTPQNTRSGASLIAEEKAVRLAKAAALRQKGSLERYEIISTELGNGWLVTVQLKRKSPTIMGGTTEYFIDKEGEKITDVRLHQ